MRVSHGSNAVAVITTLLPILEVVPPAGILLEVTPGERGAPMRGLQEAVRKLRAVGYQAREPDGFGRATRRLRACVWGALALMCSSLHPRLRFSPIFPRMLQLDCDVFSSTRGSRPLCFSHNPLTRSHLPICAFLSPRPQYILHSGSLCDLRRKLRAKGSAEVPPSDSSAAASADGADAGAGEEKRLRRDQAGAHPLQPGWAGWCLAKGEGGSGELVRLLMIPLGLETAAEDWVTDPDQLSGKVPIVSVAEARRKAGRSAEEPKVGAESVLLVHRTAVQIEEVWKGRALSPYVLQTSSLPAKRRVRLHLDLARCYCCWVATLARQQRDGTAARRCCAVQVCSHSLWFFSRARAHLVFYIPSFSPCRISSASLRAGSSMEVGGQGL